MGDIVKNPTKPDSFALSSGQTGLHTCNLKKRLSEEKDFVQDLDQMMKQDMVELVDMVGTPGGIGGIHIFIIHEP